MKRLLIFLLLISGFASAQTYQKVNSYGVWWLRGLFDSTLTVPIGLDLRSNLTRAGAITWNAADSAFYGWTGSTWLKQGRTGSTAVTRALDSLIKSNDSIIVRYNNGSLLGVKLNNIPQSNIIGLIDSLKARYDTTAAKAKFLQYERSLFSTRQNDFSPFNFDTTQTVLLPSGTGFEGNMVGLGYDVVYDPSTNLYTMLYAAWNGFGNQNNGTHDVGLATSKDLITWTKYVSNPVFGKSGTPGTFDSAGVTFPQLLFDDADSLYHMYYIGFPNKGFEKGQSKIGHATAKSLYGPWSRDLTPVMQAPSGWLAAGDYIFRPTVVKEKSKYYMFFNGGPYGNERIGVATSSSAYGPFTALDTPVTYGKIAPWAKDSFASDPDVFKYKGKWYMTYWARAISDNADIGLSWTTPEEFPNNWRPYAVSTSLGSGLQTRPVMVMGKNEEPNLFYAYGDINLLYVKAAYNLPKRLPAAYTLNVFKITDGNQQYKSYTGDTATFYPFVWLDTNVTTNMPNSNIRGGGIAFERSNAANAPGIGSFRITTASAAADSNNYYIKRVKDVGQWSQWYNLWHSGMNTFTFNTSNSRAFNINVTSGFATMDFRASGARRAYWGFNTSSLSSTFGVATGSAGSETEVPVITMLSTGLMGVSTGTPTSSLDLTGSFAASTRTITANRTLDATDFTILANNSGAITITLPTAASCPKRIYVIKKISAASNNVSIQPAGAEFLDGTNTAKILTLQWSSNIIQSNGTSWFTIGGHAAATVY